MGIPVPEQPETQGGRRPLRFIKAGRLAGTSPGQLSTQTVPVTEIRARMTPGTSLAPSTRHQQPSTKGREGTCVERSIHGQHTHWTLPKMPYFPTAPRAASPIRSPGQQPGNLRCTKDNHKKHKTQTQFSSWVN